MPTSSVMQICVTVSEILWKINISVCISGLLYNVVGISSYNLGILTFFLNFFDCMALLVLIVSILLLCFVLF